ncbi:MAG TPA: DM13 domain-containing protein [Blastocatellia bacterium]|nr:DM13 domain-containing protein [Blastocatellia bacterium]
MRKRTIFIIAGLVVLAAGWYLFRPELLFINSKVDETFPVATTASSLPVALASGNFHDGAHKGAGTATIFQLPDGNRVLRLTNFETSNGPDVHVYLVAAGDATDNDTVTRAGFIDLGSLKGNIGDQNYDVPANADLGRYKAVTIWCRRFSVNFATAPLAAQMSAQPVALASGSFHDVAHKGAGSATIFQLPDGKRVLRFTNFETSNGPDVRVYLVAADDATDNDTVTRAGFIELGALKGNVGDQNYDVPAEVDLSKYRAVTIWCRRFSVNFATAPLAKS